MEPLVEMEDWEETVAAVMEEAAATVDVESEAVRCAADGVILTVELLAVNSRREPTMSSASRHNAYSTGCR